MSIAVLVVAFVIVIVIVVVVGLVGAVAILARWQGGSVRGARDTAAGRKSGRRGRLGRDGLLVRHAALVEHEIGAHILVFVGVVGMSATVKFFG